MQISDVKALSDNRYNNDTIVGLGNGEHPLHKLPLAFFQPELVVELAYLLYCNHDTE